MKSRTNGLLRSVFLAMGIATSASAGCVIGSEACPSVLRMHRGSTKIAVSGKVSADKPDYFSRFSARAGQILILHAEGGGLKTSGGIDLSHPASGFNDSVEADTPFRLPENGVYVIHLRANTMSEGPFGRFVLSIAIRAE